MKQIVESTARSGASSNWAQAWEIVSNVFLSGWNPEIGSKDVELNAKQVDAIRKGKYLYNPKVLDDLATLGKKLANIDRYVLVGDETKIERREAQALLGDLEDFLELWQTFEDSFLELRATLELDSESILLGNSENFKEGAARWVQSKLLSIACPGYAKRRKWKKLEEEGVSSIPLVKLPRAMEKKLQARKAGGLLHAGLELANQLTDVFVAFKLNELGMLDLFWLSVAALILTFLGRVGLALRAGSQVDWRNKEKARRYVLGLLLAGFEPNFAFDGLINRSLKERQVLPQNVIGTGQVSQDEVVAQAKKAFEETKVDVTQSLIVIFSEDIPQLAIQIIYFVALRISPEMDNVFYASMAATIAHLLNELNKILFAYREIPVISTIINVRNLIFDSGKDDGSDSTDSSQTLNDTDEAEGIETNALSFAKQSSDRKQNLSVFRDVEDPQEGETKPRNIKQAVIKYFDATKAGHDKPSLPSGRATYRQYQSKLQPALAQNSKFYQIVRRAMVREKVANQRVTEKNSLQAILRPMFNRMLPGISVFSSVRMVEFSNSKSIDAETLRVLVRFCPSLQTLHLAFCESIDDFAMQVLKEERCPNLSHLVIDSCPKISDIGIEAVADCCRENLLSISLQNLPKISSKGIVYLVSRCPFLQSIILDQSSNLSGGQGTSSRSRKKIDEGALRAIATFCGRSLRRLRLANAIDPKVSPKSLSKIVESFNPYLEEASLSGNPRVDDQVLDALSERCRFLSDLHLSETPVSDTGVRKVADRCKNLKVISLGDTQATPAGVFDLVEQNDQIEHVRFGNSLQLLEFLSEQFEFHSRRIEFHQIEDDSGVLLRMIPVVKTLRGQIINHRSSFSNADETALLADRVARFVDYARRLHNRNFEHLPDRPGTYSPEEQQEWDLSFQKFDTRATLALSDALERYLQGRIKPASKKFLDDSVNLLERFTRRVSGYTFGANEKDEKDDESSEMSQVIDSEDVHFPFASLPPFGVAATTDINLRVNFQKGTYELVVEKDLWPQYTVQPSLNEAEKDGRALQGNISPLTKLNFALADSIDHTFQFMSVYARQKLYVPSATKYYCFAYPIHRARHDIHFHERRSFEDIPLRLATFGGFLYFDENKRFLSASALTIGNTFSFNGPFTLGNIAVKRLSDQNRWQPFTRQGSRHIQFAFLFPNESLDDPAAHHNSSGSFVYRIENSPTCFLFSISPLADVLLDPSSVALW